MTITPYMRLRELVAAGHRLGLMRRCGTPMGDAAGRGGAARGAMPATWPAGGERAALARRSFEQTVLDDASRNPDLIAVDPRLPRRTEAL